MSMSPLSMCRLGLILPVKLKKGGLGLKVGRPHMFILSTCAYQSTCEAGTGSKRDSVQRCHQRSWQRKAVEIWSLAFVFNEAARVLTKHHQSQRHSQRLRENSVLENCTGGPLERRDTRIEGFN